MIADFASPRPSSSTPCVYRAPILSRGAACSAPACRTHDPIHLLGFFIAFDHCPRATIPKSRDTVYVLKILLLSTYELGRQPFGLASPAAWLRKHQHSVLCFDLSRQSLDESAVREADLIVFYLPMHTATRLALQWLPIIRARNPRAHLCACGLYAPLNEPHLRAAGFSTILGPEFEADLAQLADAISSNQTYQPSDALDKKIPRLTFEIPDRTGLPPLRKYAHVILPQGTHRTAGYTEASRGCKHLCRHCPIVPVYSGQFRIISPEIVLADIRQQVQAGAEHITFGDPDLFNGIKHALRIVEALHAEHPKLTYDVTIKIEHLLRHNDALPVLAHTGCLFITTAVESLDDQVLVKLEKGHTRVDFFRAVDLCTNAGLTLQPTFVPFTPWTTRESYFDLLETIAGRNLVASVPSIQLAIRLLIPSRSRLLELPEIATLVGDFDSEKLVYPWNHPDPRMDTLAQNISRIVAEAEKKRESRSQTFEQIWEAAAELQQITSRELRHASSASRPAPYLSEPWYC
jgi:radical SAM superfamily enzyme YgiQ (UPF0313 family)